MSDYYYTDERNAQIVISLLKAHGIKRIVASPGTTNICLVASLQQDSFFEIYSSADERSAGYIACGLSAESGEPVVLSCTGATASRNYMSALTEAYYRKLPILVITSSRSNFQIGHNIDQVTDRTVLPKDVAKLSVQLPLIFNNDEAEWGCIIAANKAILELSHRGNGPVHINLETSYSWNYNVKKLPDVRAIYRFSNESNLPKVKAERIAIMVGAHLKWDDRLVVTVERFCELYNAVVLCDHTSNYKGKYGIFANLSTQQRNFDSIIKKAEMIIHLGDISASKYNIAAKEVWRVNPDGELRDPYKKLHYVFEMEEVVFFEKYVDISNKKKKTEFYDQCSDELKELKESLKHQNTDVINKEKELIANAKLEAKQILLDAKETADSIIKDINSSKSASQANKLRNELNEKISNTKIDKKEIEVKHPIQRDLIKPGLNVYVTNYNSDGIVMSNISKDDKVQVQIGAMKLKVDIKYLQEKVSSSKNTNNYSYTGRNNLKSQSVSPEINLLGLTVDEAVPLVDKYLDDCFMAKLSPVRIVHGKGTGALRNGIHKYLKTNKYVDSYRMGTFGEGEMGVTIVTLKIK